MNPKTGTVTFIGAGPGDPDLLTIRGQAAIAEADLVIYAGSLVPREILASAGKNVPLLDSATLTLEETHEHIRETALAGGRIARVHTGDPALYGALREQIRLLDADGIPWRIVPGITAASAAAAAAGISFTNPEISQSLIITRVEGRTPMPESENVSSLASHHTAMAIYLSAGAVQTLQTQLLKSLDGKTPVLCAMKVGWPDEKLIWTTVEELAECARKNELTRQTVFLVLPGQSMRHTRSRLYARDFSHMFRK